jgi:DNA-binding MarR family transcriptional regulator
MSSPKQVYERAKLRVLQLLSDPANVEYGASMTAINQKTPFGTMNTLKKLLAELQTHGLIERRQDPSDSRIQPFFITLQGKDYLASATEKALFPEIGQRQGWSARESGSNMQQAAAAFLRRLPEFRDSSEARIQEVSRDLAEAIGIPAPQTARRDAERTGR